MKKTQISSEEKAINLIKRTSSDINQLYGELESELSEEFLKTDNEKESENIKKALDIISDQKEKFLVRIKSALADLQDKKDTEEKIEVINEDKKAPEEMFNMIDLLNSSVKDNR